MLIRSFLITLGLMLFSTARAEERPSPVNTALSSTTISGYLDVAVHWNPGSPPILFEDLCRALRQGGFQFKKSNKYCFVSRSGKFTLCLRKQGPFARRADIRQVQRLLAVKA